MHELDCYYWRKYFNADPPDLNLVGWDFRPKPVTFRLVPGREPKNTLQLSILDDLKTHLEPLGYRFQDPPHHPDQTAPTVDLSFIDEVDGRFIRINEYTQEGLPHPGPFMTIRAQRELPPKGNFDQGRGMLVDGLGNYGFAVAGDPDSGNYTHAFWASMPGNYADIHGDKHQVALNLAMRTALHYGTIDVNDRKPNVLHPNLSWQDWSQLPFHSEIVDTAHQLNKAGLLDDRVPLERYPDKQQRRTIRHFLGKQDFGEGMRAQLIRVDTLEDPDFGEYVLATSLTGPGKVNVSKNPNNGHFPPVGRFHKLGYQITPAKDSPIDYLANTSVETLESLLIAHAGALALAGKINTFREFALYYRQLDPHKLYPVIPPGLRPLFTVIEHEHHQPIPGTYDRNQVLVGRINPEEVPPYDFNCGTLPATMALLSAFFDLENVREARPFEADQIGVLIQSGHGITCIGNNRTHIVDTMTQHMKLQEPIRV